MYRRGRLGNVGNVSDVLLKFYFIKNGNVSDVLLKISATC